MSIRKRRHYRRGRRRGSWFSRLSIAKKVGVCVAGVALCLMASGVIYVAAKLGKIDTEDIDAEDIVVNEEAESTGEGYTNVALFGTDSRAKELDKGTRSDCIIVASLNNKTKEVRMVSVYRDTLLDIKDGQLQKCNAAYSYGGPTQAINMLNKNLDLDIQDYVTVDFSAIANAIDLLGGLDIEIKEEEVQYLNKFVGETARVSGKKANKITEAGMQHLDGVQATTYARIRSTAGGDFTRTERQRLVIEKIVEKAQKSDLATINKIIDEVFPSIKTSFSIAEILSYAKDFTEYSIGASSGFPFDKTTDTISGLGSIVIPVTLEDNVKQLHEYLYDDKEYQPSSEVSTISAAVVSRVGQREATDDSTLNSQTYTTTEEDRAQEHDSYYSSGNTDSSGSSTSSGNGSGSSSGSTGSGSSGGGSSSGDSGGSSGSGSGSGGSDSGGSGGSTTDPGTGGGDSGEGTTDPGTGGGSGGGTTDPGTGGEGSGSGEGTGNVQ